QRSTAMPGDASLEFDKTGLASNAIQALQADGVQIGSDPRVNASRTAYLYVAWKTGGASVRVGSYAANDADNRSIAGIGFRPGSLIPKATTNELGLHRPASLAADATLSFGAAANVTNAIQRLDADGFQVGTAPSVNSPKATYFWIAFQTSGAA